MTTRFERITALLDSEYVPFQEPDTEDVVRKILAIADDRELWGTAEISAYLGRPDSVWSNWVARGSHGVPEAAYTTRRGSLWDADDVRAWHEDHLHLGPAGN